MSSGKALPRARAAAHEPNPAAGSRNAGHVRRAATIERRRRQRHFARRRRDLLEDCVVAAVLAILIFSVTAGLGVVALMAIPLGAALIGSFVAERVIRRRRLRGRG